MKLFNVTNHTLTPEQIADARESLGVTEIVNMPDELRQAWANVDPRDSKAPAKTAATIVSWLSNQDVQDARTVLLAGDARTVYLVLELSSEPFCVADFYAATSERQSVEETQPDGSVVKKSVFKHVAFMPY